MRRQLTSVMVLALLLGVIQTLMPVPARAAEPDPLRLPPGFRLVDYPTGQRTYNLTNFAWLEDGGLLSTGRDGVVAFAPVGGSPRTLATVASVRSLADHGLLGLALANDYPRTGRVYLAYDRGDPAGTGFGMVEEWRASPPASPTSFTRTATVLDGRTMTPQLTQLGPTHGIDAVVVAPDDSLFVSIGDDAANNGDPRALRAQDLDQPFGKILRLTPDGRGVPSNPYFSAAADRSWRSMVYASGFRNPFRFTLDPRSGLPFVGDVGWNALEELNTVPPGTNAGWPCFEGANRTTFGSDRRCQALYAEGSARLPLWSYPHAGAGASVVGGVHYTGTSYPARYRGGFFFGDYSRRQLWTLDTDLQGRLTRSPEADGFGSRVGAPVAFAAGPNGDVSYADLVSGKVRRLVYSPGNRAPVAAFSSSTEADTRTVTFTAADASYDLDGDQLSYSWDFGDGSAAATGPTATHRYAADDPATVTLTVTDQLGARDLSSVTVYPANHSPRLALEAPAARTYAVGEQVSLSATATDVEDGELTVRWDTTLLHCPFAGSCHRHPDGSTDGPVFREPFTDHGSDTSMLITATATDRTGTTVTASYDARPRLQLLAVDSPVAVAINGVTATSAEVVAGSAVELEAPRSSSYWSFTGWDDGGGAKRTLTMPERDLTLRARYSTAIDARYQALGGSASLLGRPTSTEYDLAGGRARAFAGGRLFWSAETGAREVHGSILTRYLAGGGPARYGFPVTDETAVPGGRVSRFTRAHLYWSRPTGAREVYGAILARYLALGGPARWGLPTSDEVAVPGGRMSAFGSARIYWSRRTGARVVYGAILRRYAAMGAPASCLGFPTTDEYAVPGGRRSRFVGGSITFVPGRGATARC